ncbi:unnamed protein product, partial [Discosporangium mesarthrocarpum]
AVTGQGLASGEDGDANERCEKGREKDGSNGDPQPAVTVAASGHNRPSAAVGTSGEDREGTAPTGRASALPDDLRQRENNEQLQRQLPCLCGGRR